MPLLRRSSASESRRGARPSRAESCAAEFRSYLERWGFRSSRELMLTVPTPRATRGRDRAPQASTPARGSGARRPARAAGGGAGRAHAGSCSSGSHPCARCTPCLSYQGVAFSHAARRDAGVDPPARARALPPGAAGGLRLRRILLAIGDRLVASGVCGARRRVFLDIDAARRLARRGAAGGLGRRIDRGREGNCTRATCAPLRPERRRPRSSRKARPCCAGLERAAALTAAPRGGARRRAAGGRALAWIAPSSRARPIRAGPRCSSSSRGLVVERGECFLHGAIIAREYGIPAVVGVPGRDGSHPERRRRGGQRRSWNCRNLSPLSSWPTRASGCSRRGSWCSAAPWPLAPRSHRARSIRVHRAPRVPHGVAVPPLGRSSRIRLRPCPPSPPGPGPERGFARVRGHDGRQRAYRRGRPLTLASGAGRALAYAALVALFAGGYRLSRMRAAALGSARALGPRQISRVRVPRRLAARERTRRAGRGSLYLMLCLIEIADDPGLGGDARSARPRRCRGNRDRGNRRIWSVSMSPASLHRGAIREHRLLPLRQRNRAGFHQRRGRSHGQAGRFRFQRCVGCGFVYQRPRLRIEHIKPWYDDEYIAHRKKTDWGG